MCGGSLNGMGVVEDAIVVDWEQYSTGPCCRKLKFEGRILNFYMLRDSMLSSADSRSSD